jgi:hypothetical protein
MSRTSQAEPTTVCAGEVCRSGSRRHTDKAHDDGQAGSRAELLGVHAAEQVVFGGSHRSYWASKLSCGAAGHRHWRDFDVGIISVSQGGAGAMSTTDMDDEQGWC